jgi:tetratricopeptide (TPR) repeat protein
MSSDPNDPLGGLDDLDWESALDEWEQKSFTPEVAKEKESAKELAPRAAPGASAARTMIAPVPEELRSAPPPAASKPPLAARASATPPERVSSAPASAPSRTSVTPARGGLQQLFSRPPQPHPLASQPTREASPPSSAKTRVAPIYVAAQREPAESFPEAENPTRKHVSDSTLVAATPGSLAPPTPAQAISPAAVAASIPERASRPPAPSDPDVGAIATKAFATALHGEEHDDDATLVRSQRRERARPDRTPDGGDPDAETATRLPADAPPPRGAAPSAPTLARVEAAPAPAEERLVSPWIPAEKAREYAARVEWLEEEARSLLEPAACARALLAVSELCALRGDRERAHALAIEARDLEPRLSLAWRQARQLMPPDTDLLAEALDAEATHSPTPSARAHAALLAADVLRRDGRGDAAVERWERACKLDPADARGPVARAALALAQHDHTSPSLRLSENSELVGFGKAVSTALRLRGVERAGAEIDDVRVSDGLRHTRDALAAGDVIAASQGAAEIAARPELSSAALWLSATLGSVHVASRRGAARALKTLVAEGDPLARRALAARGMELGDPELVGFARSKDSSGAFQPPEHAVLGALVAKELTSSAQDLEALAALSHEEAMASLVDALTSVAGPADDDGVDRASLVSGTNDARPLASLGRRLAARASDAAVDAALASIPQPRPASASGVAIEAAARRERWAELSDAIASLPEDAGAGPRRHVAAALVAERADDHARARHEWSEVAEGDDATDGLLRIAGELDPELDLGAALLRAAEAMPDGSASAVLRLEALARNDGLSDEERGAVLERVHRAAPSLGIGASLAERAARRRGDVEDALRWIQERRTSADDPFEGALDAVREAMLVADRDPELAATRLEEAHRARPDDVSLRELYERLAPEPPADRGAWREARAARASGPSAPLLWIEAALAYERAGDAAAMLRAARAATDAGDDGLARALVARAELATGETTDQTAELIERTKTEDDVDRREALERLADLDRNDRAAALLWHRSILELAPRYEPSLRWIEHALVTDGRDQELASTFEQIALALDGTRGGEVTAHAQLAARVRATDGASAVGDRTHDMARLGATQPEPSLWSLRALNAHARARGDDEALLSTSLELLERTQRPPERAALLLRASEAAARLERLGEARRHLEQAANEDPGDVVTWGLLADMRQRSNDLHDAAEACEGLARTSVVREHQLLAWHDASRIWLDEVKDAERGMSALEAAAAIDVTYADVFPRLSALYAERKLDAELARLLERRLESVEDEGERVALEVELSRALADMGDVVRAKARLTGALRSAPDHTTALGAMADLCEEEGDWAGAEQALVRLARLLSDPKEQRVVYERLGELYSVRAPNLSRAEVALREVLKRAPDDRAARVKLVDVYRRQGDVPRAVEVQQELVAAETDPDARLASLIELAKIHEDVGRDPRRSEQVLDSARKEFPTSVVALRALAEFYARQRQMPAMQILLDRAAGDARRAFAQGRFVPSLFQVLHAAFELRGKRDAAHVVAATLAAVEGQPATLRGGDATALDPRLDDLLAPELVSPAFRTVLARAGDALDASTPVDRAALKAVPLQPGTALAAAVGAIATVIGLGSLQVLVSPVLGRVAVPVSTVPPTLIVGEGLAKVTNERTRAFVLARALKMIVARSSTLLRAPASDVEWLVAGLFNAYNPTYVPQGMDPKRVAGISARIAPGLSRNLDPTVGVIALEAAGMVGAQWPDLAHAVHSWASRAALLAVGDPNAALDGIAWGLDEDGAPTDSEERAAWIARSREARDLMTFSVTDAYAEARAQVGLGGH